MPFGSQVNLLSDSNAQQVNKDRPNFWRKSPPVTKQKHHNIMRLIRSDWMAADITNCNKWGGNKRQSNVCQKKFNDSKVGETTNKRRTEVGEGRIVRWYLRILGVYSTVIGMLYNVKKTFLRFFFNWYETL